MGEGFHVRGTAYRDGKPVPVVVVYFGVNVEGEGRITTYVFDTREDADAFVARVLGPLFPEVRRG